MYALAGKSVLLKYYISRQLRTDRGLFFEHFHCCVPWVPEVSFCCVSLFRLPSNHSAESPEQALNDSKVNLTGETRRKLTYGTQGNCSVI